MILSGKLASYLVANYLKNFLSILFGLLIIIYLFDTVELLRRASKADDLSFILILQMGLLKLPEVGQILFPFAILFSAIFTFWHLSRRQELTVVRSAGFSVWQFLGPIIFTSIVIGALNITVINPVGAAFLSKFERLENEHLSHKKNYVTLLKEGLWLRQTYDDSDLGEQDNVILHAQKIELPDWKLSGVMVLFFDNQDQMVRRIDSKIASLEDGHWAFHDVLSHDLTTGLETTDIPYVQLPTDLTTQDLEESFSSPETVSFWALPKFIRIMNETGFDTTQLRIHFHTLLAQPFMFAAMILLAATVSLRVQRMQKTLPLISLGIAAGFIVFFLSSFLQALGASQQIPVILAAWAPSIITGLFGLAVILNLEDG